MLANARGLTQQEQQASPREEALRPEREPQLAHANI